MAHGYMPVAFRWDVAGPDTAPRPAMRMSSHRPTNYGTFATLVTPKTVDACRASGFGIQSASEPEPFSMTGIMPEATFTFVTSVSAAIVRLNTEH